MKLLKIVFGVVIMFSVLGVQSCKDKKDDEIPDTDFNGIKFTQNGMLTLSFEHYFNNEVLKFDPNIFVTSSDDTVKISDLLYYITNVTLIKPNGDSVNLANYSLINAQSETKVVLSNVPAGVYSKIKFLIGVDPVRNSSGVQEGALDPSWGMFWTWSTGYIFYRIKGWHSAENKGYSYDVGGDNNLMRKEINLSAYKVESAGIRVNLKADIANFFNSPNAFDLKTNVNEVHNANASVLATLKPNIVSIFSVSSVQSQ